MGKDIGYGAKMAGRGCFVGLRHKKSRSATSLISLQLLNYITHGYNLHMVTSAFTSWRLLSPVATFTALLGSCTATAPAISSLSFARTVSFRNTFLSHVTHLHYKQQRREERIWRMLVPASLRNFSMAKLNELPGSQLFPTWGYSAKWWARCRLHRSSVATHENFKR